MEMTSKATWIWYPGDYEIWLGNKMNSRRTERGAFFPPFWKMDSHYVTVEFSKVIKLAQPEEIHIEAEGIFNLKLDGKLQFGRPITFLLPAGEHHLNIKVWNQATPPALYVAGETVYTDGSWKVTYEDKEWIDESGKASDTSATLYQDAGCWNFNTPEAKPSLFALQRTPMQAVEKKAVNGGVLYDFGRETFGYAVLEGLTGEGIVELFYGESAEEATDTEQGETLDKVQVVTNRVINLSTMEDDVLTDRYVLGGSKAFRYIWVRAEAAIHYTELSMEYEYAPVTYRGSFRCNDEELNKIWEVGAYTMHLTTREFFIDGIKRDRWVWSGDAIQSYLMNYYLFFDSETVKRTIWLLRGKDPVTAHTNTILDYTFYWFMSIYDYYQYTGDRHFVQQVFPRMQTMMEYVLGRTNADGMVEGLTGDWVFVDWADFPMSKQGALAFEQILFCRSLETMQLCASLLGEAEEAGRYAELAKALKAKLLPVFWNESKKALVHNVEGGRQSEQVNKFPNMFALLLNYLDEEKQQTVMEQVMLNDAVLKITTPYMRFYELAAMCEFGHQAEVLPEMKAYWGGMLKEGATSFWEKYNPEEHGTQHLAMYGRPYGKSLCHAWGASPVYLLGKYYLGVKPVKPGYEEFAIQPTLGGLQWMEGTVPTPNGEIKLSMNDHAVKVTATEGQGYLTLKASEQPTASVGSFEPAGEGLYRLWIGTHEEITINYKY
jgi:hypothetical protein